MQNIIWEAITKDGQVIKQEQNGKYIDFTSLDKQQLICFSLFNKNNNCNYMINLKTGQFVFNGVSFSPAFQKGQLALNIITNQNYCYAKNLFWYNQMNCDFNLISKRSTEPQYVNTFAGYFVRFNYPIELNGKKGQIVFARPMIKIQKNNNKVSFSTSFTFKYIEDGIQKKMVI